MTAANENGTARVPCESCGLRPAEPMPLMALRLGAIALCEPCNIDFARRVYDETLDDALDSGIYPSPLVWELDHEPVCTDAGCDCEFSAAERAEADEIADAHRDAAIEHQDAHTIECPTCDGHGDVPSGRYSAHNPTGLVACPRCGGDRYVTCDARGEGPHVAYDAAEIEALRAEAV